MSVCIQIHVDVPLFVCMCMHIHGSWSPGEAIKTAEVNTRRGLGKWGDGRKICVCALWIYTLGAQKIFLDRCSQDPAAGDIMKSTEGFFAISENGEVPPYVFRSSASGPRNDMYFWAPITIVSGSGLSLRVRVPK